MRGVHEATANYIVPWECPSDNNIRTTAAGAIG
jgi:hypothetical protein